MADPAQLAPHLDAVRAALAAALERVSAEDVARRVRGRVWSGTRPEPVGPVAVAAFAEGLAAGDTVRRRTGLRHRSAERDGQLVVELPDRSITLPAATDAALRTLLERNPLRRG